MHTVLANLAAFTPRLLVRFAHYRAGMPDAESVAGVDLSSGGAGRIELVENAWNYRLQMDAVAGRADAIDLTLTIQHCAGYGARGVAAGLALELGRWSRDVYVLAPGSVYAGNRFDVRDGLAYPPMVAESELRQDGPPLASRSIAHLRSDAAASRFSLRAGEMTTPCLGLHDPASGTGLLLLFGSHSEVGETAVALEESADRGSAVIRLLAPGVREHQRNSTDPKLDRFDSGHQWNHGHRATIRARLFVFACADVPALFTRFAEVRRDLAGATVPPQRLPFSAAFAVVGGKHLRENWNPATERFETSVDTEGRPGRFQLGWCGGFLNTMPLLRAGDVEARQRVMRALDRFLVPASHMACGLWIDQWDGSKPAPDFRRDWTLIRRQGDALFSIAKHIAVLRRHDPAWRVPPAWEASLRREAEALLQVWRRHGALGQWIDAKTGVILLGDSSSGALVPAALALAGEVLGERSWLAPALAMGERFARRELTQGYTNGGPGDALQVPDSESAFSLVETCATLHALTGDVRWAAWGSQAADQACSWVMTRDHPMPPASPMGQIGARTVGTVFANSQNRHSAPGICTLSGDGLLRLFRATGETRHMDLLRDIARALPQFVSLADEPVGGMRPGWMNERVNTCDWEACWMRDVGDIFIGSCWCESSLLLTIVEVPGVYVRTDLGRVWACDHVDAELVGGRLRLANRTRFDATVTVLAEDAAAARRALPFDALWGVRQVEVAAGASVEVDVRG